MCLNKITKTFEIDENETEWKIGWKVFVKNNGKYYFPFFNVKGENSFTTDCLKFNEKLVAHPNNVMIDDTNAYKSGFHIFTNKEDAESYLDHTESYLDYQSFRHNSCVILPVKYRKVSVKGIQNYHMECIVAQEMIVEESICA